MKEIKNEKNKAFTLVELLVTITIIGIISAIALPQITKMQNTNNKKKYTTYEKALISSGKVYVTSYAEDLFGNIDSGCADVTLKELIDKDISKDIGIKNVTCNTTGVKGSKIRIRKAKNKYSYEPLLYCEENTGSNKHQVYASNNVNNPGECKLELSGDTEPPKMEVTLYHKNNEVVPTKKYIVDSKDDVKATVYIHDDGSGIAGYPTPEIEIKWKKSGQLNYIIDKKKPQSNNYAKPMTIPITENEIPWQTMTENEGVYTIEVYPINIQDRAENRLNSSTYKNIEVELRKYTLTYNENGGSKCPSPTVTQKKGSSWGTLCTPTKPGYVFVGWKNGSETITATSKATKNITVTAEWRQCNPSVPTVTLKKGSITYDGKWSNKNVTATASGGGSCVSHYEYSINSGGAQKGNSYTASANGTTKIKFRTCYGTNCSGYTQNYSIKIDKIAPDCGDKTRGSTTWSKGESRTVGVLCTDRGGSNCSKNEFTTKVSNECRTKAVAIGISDAAGNTATCQNTYNIYLDRTAPKVVSYHATNDGSWTHFYLKFTDLSGLNTINKTKATDGKMYYCYNGSPGGCSNICKNNPSSSSRKLIGSNYYDIAKIDNNLVNRTVDTVEIKTSNSCAGSSSYTVYLVIYACDQLNNCAWRYKSSPLAVKANQRSEKNI